MRAMPLAMPLTIAAFLIAAQTLVALHSVAHANSSTFAGNAERVALQAAVSNVSTSPPALDAQNKFWAALFGHTLDATDSASACVAWDAAFAAAGTIDSHAQMSVPVFYGVAGPPPVTSLPISNDFLGIARARAPPQA